VRDAIATQIDHLTVRDGNSMGINLINNVNALVSESVAINLRDDTPIGWYGYGVHSAGSLNTTVIGLYTERVRHATDNNGVGVEAGDPFLSKYGADIGMTVKDSVAYYSSAFSYSFHSEGRGAVLDNVLLFGSHGFVGLRGVDNKVLNAASVGDERGFQFFEYGYGDAKDMLIDSVTIREALVYVYNVQGEATNNVIQNSHLEYDYRTGNPGTTIRRPECFPTIQTGSVGRRKRNWRCSPTARPSTRAICFSFERPGAWAPERPLWSIRRAARLKRFRKVSGYAR